MSKKTAALFASSCVIPSILKNDQNIKKEWHEFGINFGMAFQIIDDIMDFHNIDKFGKEIGRDFLNSQITLPMILCFHHNNQDEKAFWQRTLEEKTINGQEDLERCIQIINKYDTLKQSALIAKSYIDKTEKFLLSIATSNNQQWIAIIQQIIQDLYNRVSDLIDE